MKNYLKNDLFEGITGKNEYLILFDDNNIDTTNTVLIAIHDPDSKIHTKDKIQGFDDILQIQFWDIEEGIGKYTPITKEQGLEIKDFIQKNKNKKFFIHCEAGQSRSAGVGCTVECLVNFNGNAYEYLTGNSEVKKHTRYSPNYVVFDAIIK